MKTVNSINKVQRGRYFEGTLNGFEVKTGWTVRDDKTVYSIEVRTKQGDLEGLQTVKTIKALKEELKKIENGTW